jgi:hypothetical protein
MFLDRLGADGIFKYNTPRSGPDYGRTMPGREASGLAGQLAFSALDLAVLSGDRATIDRAVEAVRTLDRRFAHAVPRGAQTWEIALHTPDILASAHLAGANARAFELTGDPAFLDAARYWAWTGVPFVYLVDPFPSQGQGQGVGPYATIPVLGSTNWVAPVWIGLPVQWCGLVYADALDRLARIDPDGPWRTLVSGIARSGIQQTYPIDHDRRGLLPDSFTLATRTRNPADINPATLQPLAIPALGGPRCDDFACLRDGDLLVFAPGAIGAIEDTPARVSFTVAAWSREPSAILIHGLKTRPRAVRVDGQESALAGYLPDTGTAIIRIPGPGRAGIGVGVGVAIDR